MSQKKNKNVILVSSMHESDDIDAESGDRRKPEVITFYNMTKGGVDVVDKMKSEYTVARIGNRWPLALFYGLLDVAGINSQIIYKLNTGNMLERRKYLRELSMQLTQPLLKSRLHTPGLSTSLQEEVRGQLGLQASPPRKRQQEEMVGRQVCSFCPKKKNRKTTVRCVNCRVAICGEHTRVWCIECHSSLVVKGKNTTS